MKSNPTQEAFEIESSLSMLIDLICPGLDSGDILKDAQKAARCLVALFEKADRDAETVFYVQNELACLISDVHNPKIDDWPLENEADREILQTVYLMVMR